MALTKTTRLTLVDQVVNQMESLIESEEWSVGTKIPPEPELVKRLGVSRNSIREAVRALVHVGMLEARPGDGTYVRASSHFKAALARRIQKSDVAQTLEVRNCLEMEAALLAALRRTSDDADVVKDCLRRSNMAANREDLAAFVEEDIELHRAVVAATHNSVLIDLYGHMTDSLRESIYDTVSKTKLKEHYNTHKDLVESIIAQDPNRAENAVQAHIKAFQNTINYAQA